MPTFKPSSTHLGPIRVDIHTLQSATQLCQKALKTGTPTSVAFANTNLINWAHKKPSIAKALQNFLVLNDGIGLSIAAKLFRGVRFPANLNGTDFTPHLLQSLPPHTRVFLYGSPSPIAEKAAPILEKSCNIKVVGTQDGYTRLNPSNLITRINSLKTQVLLVGTGNPRQEEWIAAHRAEIQAPLCIGVGALFDFTTGTFKRAPAWVQACKLEWAYRLAQEPRRLIKRYSWDILMFLITCWRYKSR